MYFKENYGLVFFFCGRVPSNLSISEYERCVSLYIHLFVATCHNNTY